MMHKGFGFEPSPSSGRTKIARRSIAGNAHRAKSKSVERTAEMLAAKSSFARFTGLGSHLSLDPALKVLGYYQPSAARTMRMHEVSYE